MAEMESETAQDTLKVRRGIVITGACVAVAGVLAAWGLVAGWWEASPGAPVMPVNVQGDARSTVDLDPFLVNLADTDNARFVKVTFRLAVEKKTSQEMAADRVAMAAARDAIISLLSTKTAAQILSSEGKVRLRNEVRSRVNSVLPFGTVGDVYIVDFVVQM